MRNKILYIFLFILVILGVGLIVFVNRDCDCNCKEPEKTEQEILEESYKELNNKLIEYLEDIYNNDKYINGGVEPNTYIVTLKEFKDRGYDISMFVNPSTGVACDLEKTFGRFIVIGETENGKTDFTYSTSINCQG